VHHSSVAESLKHGPLLLRTMRLKDPRTQRIRGGSSSAFMDDSLRSLSSSQSRNMVKCHLSAREDPSRGNSTSIVQSNHNNLNHHFLVATLFRCGFSTTQKIYTINLGVRRKSSHHCGERTPLPCWPHYYVILVRTRNAYDDTWKATVTMK